MKINLIQHVPFEKPGTIELWARDRRHEIAVIRLFEKARLPELEKEALLVVLGGPMSVNDEQLYPWLAEEKALLKEALRIGKAILGICLGAQLLAGAAGAKVFPNDEKEIGWFEVSITEAGRKSPYFQVEQEAFTAFHWHGETFNCPPGALILAETPACRAQAFSLGNALGLQFHLETDPENIELLLKYCAADLTRGKWVQQAEEIRRGAWRCETLRPMMFRMLDLLAAKAQLV